MSDETPSVGPTPGKPPINPGGEAWLLMKSYFKTRIEMHRDELERPGADVAFVRGKIEEIRDLFRLMEPSVPIAGTSSTY